ncbi:hypothetical protein D6827_02490, partial [Candidatus Parcubacteria bacterium]
MLGRRRFNPEQIVSLRGISLEKIELQGREIGSLNFVDAVDFPDTILEEERQAEKPRWLKEYVEKRNNNYRSLATMQETFKNPDWQKELDQCLRDFYETEIGQRLLKNIEVQDIERLTPKQAIELSCATVAALSKYDYESIKNNEKKFSLSSHDQKSLVDLLKEAKEFLYDMPDYQWPGNGVCRQFAAFTKAVFDTLKERQKTGALRNLEALYDVDYVEYDLELHLTYSKNKEYWIRRELSHAWNTFVLFSKDQIFITAVDSTNADFNRYSVTMKNWMYTNQYAETVVNAILIHLRQQFRENYNYDQQVLRQIVSFYDRRIKEFAATNYGFDSEKQTKQRQNYYAWRLFVGAPENFYDFPQPVKDIIEYT